MGFFSRLANIWNGFLSVFLAGVETNHPEAVYASAISARTRKHAQLKKAVSGIIYLRNKLKEDYEVTLGELQEVNSQIPIAVEDGDDDVALVLIESRNRLVARITELKAEMDKVVEQAEDAKSGLLAFQTEIHKLKREKEAMLAKKANAEARIKIQETLSGLSVEADVQALEGVRASIHKVAAEADLGNELGENSLDARLRRISAKAGNVHARRQLEEMKKQLAGRKMVTVGVSPTI
ncbi:MAG: PspA/IM30 family protein [Proteobacteria bacterium]|jgi:phage shock protein A|nr:PspA/IM30 family protein [Pseudomonadota bacterium]